MNASFPAPSRSALAAIAFRSLVALVLCGWRAVGAEEFPVDGGVLVCGGAPASRALLAPATPGALHLAFGDSFTEGANATGAAGFVSMLAGATGWPWQKRALPGKQIQDIVGARIYPTAVTAGSSFTTLTGLNDVRFFGANPIALETHRRTLRAGLAWLAIPGAHKLAATAAAVRTTGAWSMVPRYHGAVSGRFSSESGATAAVQLSGTTLYLGYTARPAGGSAGTFTVSVDGREVAEVESAGGVNSASPLAPHWPEVLRIAGLSPGTHELLVKVTAPAGNAAVNLDWFGSNELPAGERPPLVLAGNTPRLSAAGYAASASTGYNQANDAAVALYNDIHRQVCADLRDDGLSVFRVDVSTDYDPALAENVSADAVHPTDAGHARLANAFLRAAGAAERARLADGVAPALPSARVAIGAAGTSGIAAITGSQMTYTPGPGYSGRDAIRYVVSFPLASGDATGLLVPPAPFPVSVSVRSAEVGTRVLAVKGAPVLGIPAATLASLRSRETAAFLGNLRIGASLVPALCATDGSVRLRAGDPAPDLAGSTLAALGAPSGQAALGKRKLDAATGVAAANDTILLGGLTTPSPRLAAMEGQPFANAPGLSLGRIVAFDGTGSTIFFRAGLRGPGVSAAADLALAAARPDGTLRLLAREGEELHGQRIVAVSSLAGLAPSLAEGRWRLDDHTFGVRLGLADGRQLLCGIPADAASPADWTQFARTGDSLFHGRLTACGVPSFCPGGVAVRATLHERVPGRESAVLFATAQTAIVLARRTGPVPAGDGSPIAGAKFVAFTDPVAGAARSVAFLATIAGPGITPANNAGLWLSKNNRGARLIARTGDPAPGGGRWAALKSLVLPDAAAAGLIFTGTLRLDRAENVTAKNAAGIWAVDSAGVIRLLLRTGQIVTFADGPRTLFSFDAASSAAGSIGSAHGTDREGRLAVLATFEDRSTALLEILIP